MLNWVDRFNIFCLLDNQQYQLSPHSHELLLGAGARAFIRGSEGVGLQELDLFLKGGWSFGHLSYELKNRLQPSLSRKEDVLDYPDFYFFRPEVLLSLSGDELIITADDPQAVYRQIMDTEITPEIETASVPVQQRLQKDAYTAAIKALQEHILRGDCYEINFCQEFYAEEAQLHPLSLYRKLALLSPNPFTAFYRLEDRYLICASPERFLKREGDRLISQPIKGTIKRDLSDEAADSRLKEELGRSEKDRAENVMVVDLVRNDLSRICTEGSVNVDELFGVYAFPQVFQMISTVSGRLKPHTSFSEIIEATFPMGSMTGAPKHRVLELIDQYETGARGLFSGSVGYVNEEGDFDFNVVIRSILYHASRNYLSYRVGSGITFYSDAEREWEECLLKGAAIKKVLGG